MSVVASARSYVTVLLLLLAGCQSAPDSQSGATCSGANCGTPAVPVVPQRSVNLVQCAGDRVSLGALLEPIVASMVAQKIPYSQNPANEWRDCSGNFLRLSSYLAKRCPDQRSSLVATQGVPDYRAGGNNRVVARAQARSTREIGRWYDQRGQFKPIYYDGAGNLKTPSADLLRVRAEVRPGTVLFFSKGRPLARKGKTPLFTAGAATSIVHMGTVTKVRLDAVSGQVLGFEMYHGRNTRHPGMVTKAHFWDWPDRLTGEGAKQYPPFGNWRQSLVGIATILPAL